MALNLGLKNCKDFIDCEKYVEFEHKVFLANQALVKKTGAGNEFLGWHDLPIEYDHAEFERIKLCAQRIKKQCDVFLVIGIGGSYIGARGAVDFLKGQFYNEKRKDTPSIYFVGNNISSDYINDITEIIKDKDVCINVVSKSGTTTEPAIAFRIFKDILVEKYGPKGAAQRIYATTDKQKGALKQMADEEGYETFCIPDDIGGRYSVLTAVGLLPVAVCGADIDKVMRGAKDAYEHFSCDKFYDNLCFQYAALRNYFYESGRTTEIFASYQPRLVYFGEWLKQLFAESEGKGHKGIFPVFSLFSTDLHSIGQYIQDGLRNQFETVLWVSDPGVDITIKKDEGDKDGLNFLLGKGMNFINEQAFLGASLAHASGGVPNISISLERCDEYNYGYLVYFFLKSCALSGYVLDVNPFDQPGVEQYKNNMFALLSKPGYEKLRDKILKDLG